MTLEQWSFIKSLYSDLDDLKFFQITCSLSKEFIDQLNLRQNNDIPPEYLVIKNKYINHLGLIATGKIKFSKKREENAEKA